VGKAGKPLILAQLTQIAPKYVQVSDLVDRLDGALSRRTLQRRLEALVATGEIERHGKGRGTKYRLALNEGEVRGMSGGATEQSSEATTIKLPEPVLYSAVRPRATALKVREDDEAEDLEWSEELLELRDRVRAPVGKRKVCGYRREFLDAYEPNKTDYLGTELSERLHDIGQSDHMAALPPGTYARMVLDRLLIDLSWNSSRLEGNTFSLLETDHLLSQGKGGEARMLEAQMILNHKGAIEFLVDNPSELGFNRYTFCNLHALLTEGLLKSSKAEGRLRQIPVGISGTVYHPTNDPHLIEEIFDRILQKAAEVEDPLEQSFFLMVHLPYLQPFEDGNKRLSRIGSNLPLVQKNMSPLSFVDVPVRAYIDGVLAVYELNRVELLREVFAQAYERSAARYASIRNEIGEPEPMRVRYREEIKERMRDVVVRGLDKPTASSELRIWASREVTASDREKLVEMIETLLLDLSESNIARIKIRRDEFERWWRVWNQ